MDGVCLKKEDLHKPKVYRKYSDNYTYTHEPVTWKLPSSERKSKGFAMSHFSQPPLPSDIPMPRFQGLWLSADLDLKECD